MPATDPAIVLVRHATMVLELGDERVVVDPMLDPAGARDAVAGSPRPRPNPLVELPAGTDALLEGATAAIVTHLHADHLDAAGARFLAERGFPVQGQPEDLATLGERGIDAVAIGSAPLGKLPVQRTGGRHGVGALADRLGPVSGAVLAYEDERIYVAGDTVGCAEFDEALHLHVPTTVVLNAGGARLLDGEPITMTAGEVARIARDHPDTLFVAVHMDAINHCLDTRAALRAELERARATNVLVPDDGERVVLD
jgi:L-ascorbate metabolism protein UlaG (beta-lactamase superfamily)